MGPSALIRSDDRFPVSVSCIFDSVRFVPDGLSTEADAGVPLVVGTVMIPGGLVIVVEMIAGVDIGASETVCICFVFG